MDYRKESLRLHGEWKGKIEVIHKYLFNQGRVVACLYTGCCRTMSCNSERC